MNVIEKCVDTQMGVETFNKARMEIEKSHKVYLKKYEIYHQRSMELDEELEGYKIKRAGDLAKAAKYAAELETLEQSIEQSKKYLKDYDKRKGDLLALNFDAFGQEQQNNNNDDDDKDDK